VAQRAADGSVVLAEGITSATVAPDCVQDKRVALVSHGTGGLEVTAQSVALSGDCDGVWVPPVLEHYQIDGIAQTNGTKAYRGTSEQRRVRLVDHRNHALSGLADWTLMVQVPAPLRPGEPPWLPLFVPTVDDVSLLPSGDTQLRIDLTVDTAKTVEELGDLLFPLQVDLGRTRAAEDGLSFDVWLTTDLAWPHVAAQLSLLDALATLDLVTGT